MRQETRIIHASQEPDPRTGGERAHQPQLHLQAGRRGEAARGAGNTAARGTPADASLRLTSPRGKRRARPVFASGSAATAAVLNLLKPGPDEVLSTGDV